MTKEERYEYNKKYQQEHRDKVKEYARRYYYKNKEYYKNKSKKYRENHKEYFKEYQQQYRNNYKKEIQRLNKEKDDLDDYNRHLYNENKRLNNIIEELEKWLKKDMPKNNKDHFIVVSVISVLDKLKTLKEGK